MIGSTISHYKIIEILSTGGMGAVYKAEDTKLHRTIALKFLPPELTRDEEAKKRFIHEAQAASSIQHNNICNIHDIDEAENGQLFICMDLYEGETLKKKIERGSLKIDEAVEIIIQITSGLQKAHEKGIIHRDIKPANIFITKDGIVKILDFGLAKLSGQSMLTKTGSVLGTVAYMSPEQARGEEVDKRTDIWSMGVVFYEMLTGKSPFNSEYDQAIVYSILNEEPKPIKSLRTDVPPALEKIIYRALTKKLEDRYQSIEEFYSDLESYRNNTQLLKKTERGRSKRKIFLYTGFFILLSVVIFIIVLIVSPNRSSDISSLAVLPFVNASNDPKIEYLCDGLTEALTDQISRIPQIKKVISFNGVMYFKGKNISPSEIGKQLGVEALIMTHLSQYGDSVQLNMELVDTRENKHLWGKRFDENIRQINNISRTIVLSLVQDLHVTEIFDNPRPNTDVGEAYSLYLKARHYYHKATKDNLLFSLKYYHEAIALDPSFSLAYSGLAETLLQLSPEYFPWVEIRDSAMNCAVKAVELDDQSSQAYSALGVVKFIEADLKEAEQLLLKALALNPLYSEAYHYYAHLLAARRDFNKAVDMMQRAVELAPYSVFNRACLGEIYSFAGRWNEALSTFDNACEMDSTFSYLLYRCQLEFALVKREFEKAREYARLLSSTNIAAPWEMEWRLTRIEALAGRKNKALLHLQKVRNLTQNIQGHQRHEIDLQVFAGLYAELGLKSQAIDLIESAFAQHAGYIYLINNMPEFDVLRGDPRFIVLLRRGGFID